MLSGMKVPTVLINSHHVGEFVYSVRIDNIDGAPSWQPLTKLCIIAFTRHCTRLQY
jgi:hypothetical protein